MEDDSDQPKYKQNDNDSPNDSKHVIPSILTSFDSLTSFSRKPGF